MNDWKAKTPEERADIRGQATMKEVIAKLPLVYEDNEQKRFDWLKSVFNDAMNIQEDRLKLYTNISVSTGNRPQPQQPASNGHLSDERVAQETNLNNQWHGQSSQATKTFAFCSEKQSKRAYAISKSKGWSDFQVRSLAQLHGFQNTKKIPVGVYEQFCNDLQRGPQPLEESSSHLENR